MTASISDDEHSSAPKWIKKLLKIIESIINDKACKNGACHVALTGGRTASLLYQAWAPFVRDSRVYENVHFYFGDDRCVPLDHVESNYKLVVDTLFFGATPDSYRLHSMNSVVAGTSILPEKIDLILLSVGEDGHIASLFPNASAMNSRSKVAYISDSPKLPRERITITPQVIENAQHVIVMAEGIQKGRVLAEALNNPQNVNELPVRLTIGRTWVFDEMASISFQKSAPTNNCDTEIIFL